MNKITRNTKKSRLVSEFSDCLVDMVLSEIVAPSKSQIVDCVVNASLDGGVSVAIKTMLEDELANELDRYFHDVCEASRNVLDMTYHLVNSKYYKRRKDFPSSKAEARAEIATFANGRTGKAQGVRFITDSENVDVYLAIVAEKRMENTNAVVKNTSDFVSDAVKKGALSKADLKKISLKK